MCYSAAAFGCTGRRTSTKTWESKWLFGVVLNINRLLHQNSLNNRSPRVAAPGQQVLSKLEKNLKKEAEVCSFSLSCLLEVTR